MEKKGIEEEVGGGGREGKGVRVRGSRKEGRGGSRIEKKRRGG